MPKDIHKVYFLKTMAEFTINIRFGFFVCLLSTNKDELNLCQKSSLPSGGALHIRPTAKSASLKLHVMFIHET